MTPKVKPLTNDQRFRWIENQLTTLKNENEERKNSLSEIAMHLQSLARILDTTLRFSPQYEVKQLTTEELNTYKEQGGKHLYRYHPIYEDDNRRIYYDADEDKLFQMVPDKITQPNNVE